MPDSSISSTGSAPSGPRETEYAGPATADARAVRYTSAAHQSDKSKNPAAVARLLSDHPPDTSAPKYRPQESAGKTPPPGAQTHPRPPKKKSDLHSCNSSLTRQLSPPFHYHKNYLFPRNSWPH